MKKLLLLIALFLSLAINAQDSDKTVTLTVSGTGKTLEEAKINALRSAIEQAFGAFISTKTEILNDNLVKDEIVSVANGNIRKFDIISQVEIPNNGYAMTLNATVSISKLTSFAQSKGVTIEIKGGLFAANIIQQELNEKAELISLKNILNISSKLLKKSFDYSIETKGTPTLNNGKYDIPLKITVKLNKNFYQFRKYFINSLSGLTMNESEIANYEEIKKPIGQLIVRKDTITFQENMKKLKYRLSGMQEWKIDIDNFDENTEKILYTWGGNWTYQVAKFAPYSYFEAQRNNDLNKVFEIKSLKELKNIFRSGWLGSSEEPVDMIIYKVNNNDLGYSKIYFRNNLSLIQINSFIEKIKSVIFNFDVSNNLSSFIGNNLLANNSADLVINSWAKVALKKSENEWGDSRHIKDLISNKIKYDAYGWENYFFGNSQRMWKLTDLINKNEQKYFPNILSIFPFKEYSNNMILQLSHFNKNNEIANIDFVDTKSLEEIKQLTEYKIKPKE